MRKALAAAAVAALLFSGCARKKHARKLPAAPVARPVGSVEVGVASWYGHPYHGRPSASGEIYDMEQMTAAHRTLPFNTWVRVKNLSNEKTVDVRINDRGPFYDSRIIDLSHAAARAIELIGPGTAKVRVEVIEAPPSTMPAVFAVQVGAYRQKASAERICAEMQKRYGSAKLVRRDGNPTVWRVLVGAEPTQAGAGALADKIRSEGSTAFVVRLDS